MIKILVEAFADKDEAVVQVVYASRDEASVERRLKELSHQSPGHYFAIYDLPIDKDLTALPHYPSVAIHPDDFIGEDEL